MNIGYIRISPLIKNIVDNQLAGIPLDLIFEDDGVDATYPQLTSCVECLGAGDTLHVHSMDRLARNINLLNKLVKSLTSRGVIVHFHKENFLISANSINLLSILSAFYDFDRSVALERQREGIAIAKKAGKYKGRKQLLTIVQIKHMFARAASGETVTALVKEYGISRPTYYGYKKTGLHND